jgi:hypothetical protein
MGERLDAGRDSSEEVLAYQVVTKSYKSDVMFGLSLAVAYKIIPK